jgi:hypothetical protein
MMNTRLFASSVLVSLLFLGEAISAARRPGCWDDLVRRAGKDSEAAQGLSAYKAELQRQGVTNADRAAKGLLTVPTDKLVASLRGVHQNRNTTGFSRWAKEAEQQDGKARSGAALMRLSGKDLEAVDGLGNRRMFRMDYEELEVQGLHDFGSNPDAMLFGKTIVELKAIDWGAPRWQNPAAVRTLMNGWLAQLTNQREMARLAQSFHLLVIERPMPADVLTVFNDVFRDFLSQDRAGFFIAHGFD